MGKLLVRSPNEPFLLRLLNIPELLADTAWLDRMIAERSQIGDDHAGIALLVAAAQAYRAAAV